jgi:putative oxidoreductase
LGTILVIEIIASLLMIIGLYQLATSDESQIALIGLEISAITLILLLIGQRLAKDYAGAMALTVYFILTVFGVFLLQ